MKILIKKCIFACALIIVLIWVISFVKCEVCTFLYSSDFENVVYDGIEFGDNPKILRYSDEYAKVYYSGDGCDLVTFVKRQGMWQISSHRTVSDGGGDVAKIFVWPYFWHYIIV